MSRGTPDRLVGFVLRALGGNGDYGPVGRNGDRLLVETQVPVTLGDVTISGTGLATEAKQNAHQTILEAIRDRLTSGGTTAAGWLAGISDRIGLVPGFTVADFLDSIAGEDFATEATAALSLAELQDIDAQLGTDPTTVTPARPTGATGVRGALWSLWNRLHQTIDVAVASLPLPTGAATEATQQQVRDRIGTVSGKTLALSLDSIDAEQEAQTAHLADIKRGLTDYDQRFDYGARTDGQPERVGFADAGTAAGTTDWTIYTYTYDGSDRVTLVEVATGQVWI